MYAAFSGWFIGFQLKKKRSVPGGDKREKRKQRGRNDLGTGWPIQGDNSEKKAHRTNPGRDFGE